MSLISHPASMNKSISFVTFWVIPFWWSKFVFFSSSEIYGNPDKKNIPTKETYNGNVSSIEDRSCYDEGKRVGETLCYFYKILKSFQSNNLKKIFSLECWVLLSTAEQCFAINIFWKSIATWVVNNFLNLVLQTFVKLYISARLSTDSALLSTQKNWMFYCCLYYPVYILFICN